MVGTGPDEYRRVAHASLALFGTVAIVAFLARQNLARGYVAVALPVGMVTLLTGRWLWRQWLARRRSDGRFVSTVLVVGSHRSAVAMAKTFERDSAAGYRVVGVCVPGSRLAQGELLNVDGHAVPILGDESTVLQALQFTGANTVAVSNTDSLGTEGMRALAWQLEAVDVDMVVSAGVVDVAGPRLKIRPVAGLPLLHVEKPQYEGAGRIGKFLVDMLGATCALVLASPVLLLTAVAIKLSSRGPVFYRAERVGLNGEVFSMLKFRSMGQNADSVRTELVKLNEGAGPLFTMREDPAGDPGGPVDSPVQHRRVAPADQRAEWPDEHGRPASSVAQRSGTLRRRGEAAAVGQAGDDRLMASERAFRPVLGGVGAAGPLLRRELVHGARLDHRLWRTLRAVLKSNGAY